MYTKIHVQRDYSLHTWIFVYHSMNLLQVLLASNAIKYAKYSLYSSSIRTYVAKVNTRVKVIQSEPIKYYYDQKNIAVNLYFE